MAINKSSIFNKEDIRLSNLAKTLSHPARIAILRILAEKNMCICGDIVELLPLAQSTVSQHLKALKEINLIKGEIEGVKTCYCINWEEIKNFDNLLNKLFCNLNSCCCNDIEKRGEKND